jgi:hypothetical protein
MSTEIPLSEKARAAYERLRTAERFEESFVGIAGQPSELVAALRILRADSAADAAFKSLLETATAAGQLYALCGIYFTDPESFPSMIESFRERKDPVMLQSGCLIFGTPFADILESKSPGAVRLAGPSASLSAWRREHPDSPKLDIIGGGYPHAFAEKFPFG